MIFLTTYRFKPNMTREESAALMKVFGEVGTTPGTKAHYVAADGSGGVVIAENDNAIDGYRNLLNYGEFMDFETKVMLSIEEAVPQIMDYLG